LLEAAGTVTADGKKTAMAQHQVDKDNKDGNDLTMGVNAEERMTMMAQHQHDNNNNNNNNVPANDAPLVENQEDVEQIHGMVSSQE